MYIFKIDKMTYSKLWSRTAYDASKNKPLCILNFLFTSLKIEFNPLTSRYTKVSKQLYSTNNIFKANALIYFSFTEGVQKVP